MGNVLRAARPLTRHERNETDMTEQVGIVGAGVMGADIAQVFAGSGFEVSIHDVSADALENARSRIEQQVGRGVEKGRITAQEADLTIGRVRTVDSMAGLAESSLVIEAVAESLEVKQEVFKALDAVCPSPVPIVSNTSTLSPTEIGRVLANPGRSAGFHFFNPATRMKLVEIIPGHDTDSDTVEKLRDIAAAIDRTPVIVNESPGGIVSRLQLLVRNEAVRLLVEGVATAEDIDTAMKLGSGWPMGPLELSDMVGLDIHVNNSDILSEEMGSDRYRPHPYLRKIVRAGHLGRKTGRGIHDYGGDQ